MTDTGIDLNPAAEVDSDDIRDLLKTTLKNYKWDGTFEILQKYHNYPICNLWFQKDKTEEDGGVSILRTVRLTEGGSAAFVLPGQRITPTISDVLGQLTAPWVLLNGNYSIYRQEIMRNRGKAAIIKLQTNRRDSEFGSMFNKLEEKAWDMPTSASDTLNPRGIPYWIVPITSAQQTTRDAGTTFGSHQGTNPSGFNDCAGIDASTERAKRWRNYNDCWTNAAGDITAEDVKRISRMQRRLKFESPVLAEEMNDSNYAKFRMYANEVTLEALEERARANNDNLGSDICKFHGSTVCNNIPILWTERLDTDAENALSIATTYPLYGINHEYFKPFVMSGDNFRETGPMNSVEFHDTFTTHIDLQFQFICTNRQRAGGVISRV